ncbi:allantoate amidohydrolase [Phytoactinopolyspora halotolerans]|uniref:Allantoate amidohydrolase n=2 Tax=Phytoactinopolyspora halotolerans TaxID=1981512 RepID=A0A6L9SCZ4_9ACTN|nr:allantoate amidohydrolase [Phytoactinopolyspora halotolerans]
MWADLAPVGREPGGGYRRFAWTRADHTLREWFVAEAGRRGLSTVVDRAGNQWAWWGDPDTDGPGVVTGSHLDSVPSGGAYDGPLGVVSAFLAVDALRARGVRPSRPIGVACFADEEGARFGVACAGSRIITGALPADRARGLTDDDGTSLSDAVRQSGYDAELIGPDPKTVRRVGTFLELHIEQGRGLADLDWPVAVGNMIWPHGRWRVELAGRADHAGTTALADRDDPMLRLAALIEGARAGAARHDALATVGKVKIEPNGVNAIPSHVTAWVDCRAAETERVERVLAGLAEFTSTNESWTPVTVFDEALVAQLSRTLDAPVLSTGAGHDAGILSAAGIPAAMLFVRNPTGVSHSPDEHAERADCLAGVEALTRCLAELVA